MSNDPEDKVWKDRPELYDLLLLHERLCEEINYILSLKLKERTIDIAHTTSRVKTLPSLCEK